MKPLEDVTVLEFSTMSTASFAAMMMAEQGASVIKVEPIELGDPMRFLGSSKGGISALFANCNRGKESVRINIKEEAGQALVREMIPHVDIVIHNYRLGFFVLFFINLLFCIAPCNRPSDLSVPYTNNFVIVFLSLLSRYHYHLVEKISTVFY